jgi:hypothetical protein
MIGSVSRPGLFTPEERASCAHWLWGCVGLRAEKALEKRYLSPTGNRSTIPRMSVSSIWWLSRVTFAGFDLQHDVCVTEWCQWVWRELKPTYLFRSSGVMRAPWNSCQGSTMYVGSHRVLVLQCFYKTNLPYVTYPVEPLDNIAVDLVLRCNYDSTSLLL